MDIISYVMGMQAGKNSGGGGGSVEGVHYVTFMSEDGTTELYKRVVADGDDCADPIDRGLIPEPTKESTAQYAYTLAGWSASPNGALDENILKAIKADKTVYANFAAVLRYYTVTYYDSDGKTVLKTESLAYGATPSYKPTKDGYDFVAWTPNAVVTGNMSYTATWKTRATFETATWSEIAEVCAAGNAASTFKVGDYKPVTLTYTDGTSETINFRIVDMGVDTVGTGTAALSIMADNIVKDSTQLSSKYNNGVSYFYLNDAVNTFLTNIFNALPEDLQAVIKPYKRNGYSTGYTNIFVASALNLNLNKSNLDSAWGVTSSSEGYQAAYEYFKNGASRARTKLADASMDDYWTSTNVGSSSGGSYTTYYRVCMDGNERYTKREGNTQVHGIVPCFCI